MIDIVIAMSRGVLEHNILDVPTTKNCLSAVKTCDKLRAKYIFTCGGIFQPKKIQSISIALLMKNAIEKTFHILENQEDPEWGRDLNYPKKIITENKSLDTYQNVLFMHKKFRDFHISKNDHIIICSDFFHFLRTNLLFKKLGYTNISFSEFSEIDDDCKIKLSMKDIIKEIALILMAMYDPTGEKWWPVRQIMQNERNKRKTGQAYLSYPSH